MILALLSLAAALQYEMTANPIRKVVTLLQDMQKEITAEGKKEEGLFDQFMCYCNGNTDGMSQSAKGAAERITELTSQVEAEESEKSQLDQELVQHKKDREAATADLQKAEKIREKEHAEYVEEVGDAKQNIDSLTTAIAAISKGMGASLIQAKAGSRLRAVVKASPTLDVTERESVLAFLSGGSTVFGDYSGQSGEIVGILKNMLDSMDKDLNGAVSDEDRAASGFESLAAAKKAEIAAAGEAVEAKTARSGSLGVSIVQKHDDVEDTTKELSDTQAFLANLSVQCAQKKKDWDVRQSTRAEEIAAISEAIKTLNGDDALDLFKKTLALPAVSSSTTTSMGFLQKGAGVSAAARAATILAGAKSPQVSLIAYSLSAKAVDFTKVVGMIDSMVANLGTEQKDDDAQLSFCEKDLDKSDRQKAATQESIETSTATVEEGEEGSKQLGEEVEQLKKEIGELDKAVTDATKQRHEEHDEFLQFQTENNAAVQLIEKAKNKLNKFYKPSLYKEAPKRELTDEEKILASSGRSDLIPTDAPQMIAGIEGGTVYAQVRAHRGGDVPPPPPATWDAYQKKDGKSNGVMALMDMLKKDLASGITESKHDEETSQKDYEALMGRSQASRAQNVDSITNKEASKADLDEKVERAKEAKTSQQQELTNVQQYIVKLHNSCDFLVNNYDLRKAARATETESLKNAKAVLSGANFA